MVFKMYFLSNMAILGIHDVSQGCKDSGVTSNRNLLMNLPFLNGWPKGNIHDVQQGDGVGGYEVFFLRSFGFSKCFRSNQITLIRTLFP